MTHTPTTDEILLRNKLHVVLENHGIDSEIERIKCLIEIVQLLNQWFKTHEESSSQGYAPLERCQDKKCKHYGKPLVDRGYGYLVCRSSKKV